MPDENKEKWNPGKLYATPAFPEDEGTQEFYPEPQKRGAWAAAALIAMALVTAACVLLLTGVVKIPPGLQRFFGMGASAGPEIPAAPPEGMPVVSELMAGNQKTLEAAGGKYYDWIEIYNPTGRAVVLAGFFLSDDPAEPRKFKLPAYTLESGERLIVFASGKNPKDGELHAPFKLAATGSVLFTAPDGAVIQRIDYPMLADDTSWAASGGDFSQWAVQESPTPGKAG